MSVPSSISSSDIHGARAIPPGPWLPSVLVAVAVLLLFVGVMELRLAARGFHATVLDSDSLWLQQRHRVDALGSKALILVGASRMQLDMDLGVLRQRTGLEPVQLAIDGSSFMPVLDGLAKDPKVVGTLIVDFQDDVVNAGDVHDAAERLEGLWENAPAADTLPNYHTVEGMLGDALHHRLRSYADGASPLSSLLLRILQPHATPQYLITLPDRSRLADYTLVPMPDFYFARVMRNLGEQAQMGNGTTWADVDNELRQRVDRLTPDAMQHFELGTKRIGAMVDAIQRRGGKVIFVVMPRTGLVRGIDEQRYPHALYWDRFVASTKAKTVDFLRAPELQGFRCPDGSHLDFRDRARFTGEAVSLLGLDRNGIRSARE